MAAKTTRTFRVDPSIIRTLIANQAGSLQKAIMEGVANSIDAGATRVDLTLGSEQVVVSDDGAGLTSEKDILSVFEVFGFNHSGLDRTHGRFGVGRGQMFCYGVNEWRTNTFSMEVDIENKGLDYDLRSGLPGHTGMRISIRLYQPLDYNALAALEEEIANLVKYAEVPVYCNGRLVTRDPSAMKWPLETQDAWMNLRRTGDLAIYSQGLLVEKISNYRFGCGGEVVTKPGHAFKLNMARNDVLTASCPVWKRLSPQWRRFGDEQAGVARQTNTLTDGQRERMAKDAMADPEQLLNRNTKVFTLTNGKHVALSSLHHGGAIAAAPRGDRMGDILNQRKTATVLAEETLSRFGVSTPSELLARLRQLSARAVRKSEFNWQAKSLDHLLGSLHAYDSLAELGKGVDLSQRVLANKDMTPAEREVLKALVRVNAILVGRLNRVVDATGASDQRLRHLRTLHVAESSTMEACTDGHANIWLERSQLRHARRGLAGFLKLTQLMLHEYVHSTSTEGSHQHDQDFFETFHEAALHGVAIDAAVPAFASWLRHAPGRLAKPIADSASLLFDPDQILAARALPIEDLPEEVEVAPPAKTTRKRRARTG